VRSKSDHTLLELFNNQKNGKQKQILWGYEYEEELFDWGLSNRNRLRRSEAVYRKRLYSRKDSRKDT